MDNMEIYNAVRAVPPEAIKTINAGRLKGFSDINPMWRIKTLTDKFGPCGIGWYYRITNRWLENGADGVVSAFVELELYIKYDGEWSAPIVGIGGSSFVANEKNGAYTSDECYKMALTDALSVSCKALGFGADVYYDKDRTKYTVSQGESTPKPKQDEPTPPSPPPQPREYKCCDCGKTFEAFTDSKGKVWNAGQVYHMAVSANIDGKPRCKECALKAGTRKERTNG